jgi:hypothetical protein
MIKRRPVCSLSGALSANAVGYAHRAFGRTWPPWPGGAHQQWRLARPPWPTTDETRADCDDSTEMNGYRPICKDALPLSKSRLRGVSRARRSKQYKRQYACQRSSSGGR